MFGHLHRIPLLFVQVIFKKIDQDILQIMKYRNEAIANKTIVENAHYVHNCDKLIAKDNFIVWNWESVFKMIVDKQSSLMLWFCLFRFWLAFYMAYT